MRWVIGFLVLSAIALSGALVWFLTSQPGTFGATGVRSPEAFVPEESPDGGPALSESSPVIRMDDQALLRLEAELAHAPETSVKSDEERLAAAWEWVRANRPPDRAYNDLEARMLALADAIFDGEEQSILWAMNRSILEFEMVRAFDADGDGLVTDAEMQAFSAENMSIASSFEHPYLRSKLDADGDGRLSSDELARLHGLAGMQGALAGVIERARVEAWDSDLDGVLSGAEAAAGIETALANVKVFEDGHLEVVSDASMIDAGEQQAVRESLAENFGTPLLEMTDVRREILAVQALAQGLLDAMRVDNMDASLMRAQAMADFPRAPEQADFDANGDGQIDGVEGEAFAAAAVEYQKQVAEWSARQTAMTLRRQFEHAAREHDLNGDGRLSDAEWDTRLDDLLAARRKRLFLRSYDLDGSGRVDPTELTRFLDWHKEGSIRADANFDGVVNVLDLQTMMENYTGQ